MEERITLDMLTQDGVSIKKQQYIVQGGEEYAIGQPWRRAYVNSEQGRKQVEEEMPEPYKSVIFLIWGNGPTVIEDGELS